jgi:hypothetical protein
MPLNPNHIAKLDPVLQAVLFEAQKDEVFRVSVLLDASEVKANSEIFPSQFSSRQTYRQALIEQRRIQMREALSTTLEHLKKLSFKVQVDTISPVVMLEGTAEQILKAIELSDVRYASLDRLIGIPNLIPNEQVNYIADLYTDTLSRDLDNRTREQITFAAEQYILKYSKEYGLVQVLGMPKPVKLESVFTGVYLYQSLIVGEEEKTQDCISQTIEQTFEIRDDKLFDGIEAANKNPHLMVWGAPGSGKSTLLRKIGFEAFKGKQGSFEHKCLPVLIELRFLTNDNINLEQKIIEKFKICNFPFTDQFAAEGLSKGKLLILLDGLDEVPPERLTKVKEQIQRLKDLCAENHIICSSRKAVFQDPFQNPYQKPFSEFKRSEIASFRDEQIKQFIQKWFSSLIDKEANTAERCWKLLNTVNHRATKELAKTPLLLTFICLLYDRYQDFPVNRSILYAQALDILLERWWSEKRVQIDPIYRRLGANLEKRMLSEIAYTNFIEGKLLDRYNLEKQIQDFLESNENAPKDLDAGIILDAIVIEQGIFIEQAKDDFSFSHLTFQEFLTAQYIVDRRKIKQLVSNRLTDQRWKEVFPLVAGLLPTKIDNLLFLIEKEIQNYLSSEIGQKYLIPLLSWVENVTTGSQIKMELIERRCLAFLFASANVFAYSYSDAYSRAIPQAFNLAYSPVRNSHVHTLPIAFSITNVYTLADSFVSKDLINLYGNAPCLLYAFALAKAYLYTCIYRKPNINEFHNALSEFTNYARAIQKSNIFNNKINISLLIGRLENLRGTVPDTKQIPSVYRRFSNTIIDIWLDALNFNAELIKLSKKDLEAIDKHYTYMNLLLLQCKQEGVNVSREAWQLISSQLLSKNFS